MSSKLEGPACWSNEPRKREIMKDVQQSICELRAGSMAIVGCTWRVYWPLHWHLGMCG